MALALGRIEESGDWERFAQLCLTYSDAPKDCTVLVQLGQGDRLWKIETTKKPKEFFREWLIQYAPIELKDVTKSYPTEAGEVRALQGINLSVDPGELIILSGRSGCGKRP